MNDKIKKYYLSSGSDWKKDFKVNVKSKRSYYDERERKYVTEYTCLKSVIQIKFRDDYPSHFFDYVISTPTETYRITQDLKPPDKECHIAVHTSEEQAIGFFSLLEQEMLAAKWWITTDFVKL
jgi:hypothetical protein